MPAKNTDKAYAAGFLDGEGCIGIYHRSNSDSWVVSVRIANTDLAVLQWVQSLWEGHINQQPTKAHQKLAWSWAAHTRTADKFLMDVRPYVKIKRRQLDNALAFRKYVGSKHYNGLGDEKRAGQRALAEAQAILNRRGRD